MSKEESLRDRIVELEKELAIRTAHLDLSTDGYFDWDLRSPDFEYLSPKFWKTFGYNPDEKKHSPQEWRRIVHPDDLALATKAFEEHISTGKEYNITIRYRHSEGHWEWVICRGQAIFDDQGNLERFVGAHQSITKLKQAQEDLEEFAYHAAHDLQEPLRKISAFGERLQKHSEGLPDRAKMYLDRMMGASQRMSVLIDDLLKYARITRENDEMGDVDTETVIRDLLDDFELKLESAGATVTLEGLEPILGHGVHMRQLFSNLIGNAIKFRSPNRPLEIEIEGHRLGPLLEITVSDNGIGFENQYKDRIFKIFHRLHGREEYPGTGVGLALCRRIVEKMGGSISAEGDPGEGSIFTIALPRAPKI
jgi:PAS domain S-box-containing protein